MKFLRDRYSTTVCPPIASEFIYKKVSFLSTISTFGTSLILGLGDWKNMSIIMIILKLSSLTRNHSLSLRLRVGVGHRTRPLGLPYAYGCGLRTFGQLNTVAGLGTWLVGWSSKILVWVLTGGMDRVYQFVDWGTSGQFWIWQGISVGDGLRLTFSWFHAITQSFHEEGVQECAETPSSKISNAWHFHDSALAGEGITHV